jgi:hypothetical protein
MVYFKDYPHFKPDYTPRQMFQQGIFGGTYFRPIHSHVTKKKYSNIYLQFDFLKDLDKKKVDNGIKDPKLNKYLVNASLPLEYWETHDWIHPQDPYGQVHWYCSFYSGRRTEDDKRQTSRALRVLVRFGQRKQTPKIKQALLHWGWDPNKDHSTYIEQIKKNKWATGSSRVNAK